MRRAITDYYYLARLMFSTVINEWCIYIVLYCVLLYTQSALQSCGGGGSLLHLDDVTAATGQRRQCAHHTPATGGEERESLRQSSVWGLLGGHDWRGPVVGIWPGHRGYTPTLYHLSLTSHLKDGACWQYSVPVTTLIHQHLLQQQPSFLRRSPIQVLTRLNPA